MSTLSEARRHLLREIQQEVRYTRGYTGRGALHKRVVDALQEVPRELFVPDDFRFSAYDNNPLPIGHGQTISQPYIVAIMTELLDPRPEHRVLEIGTGSGYQAAILSHLVAEVYTVEVIAELSEQATRCFKKLGCENIHARVGDGCFGWPEQAPFDAILVTAATPEVPPALIEQLKTGGRLLAPLGGRLHQTLTLIRKDRQGALRSESLLPVVFVPLTGGRHDG